MICKREECGHPIEAHGDRAVFPPCEGAPVPVSPINGVWRGRGLLACECKGFLG